MPWALAVMGQGFLEADNGQAALVFDGIAHGPVTPWVVRMWFNRRIVRSSGRPVVRSPPVGGDRIARHRQQRTSHLQPADDRTTGRSDDRTIKGRSAGNPLQPPQIRPQHRRHEHAAIGLLVGLQQRDQAAGHRQAGAVEGVEELGLTRLAVGPGRAVAQVGPTGLEVGEDRAARYLQPAVGAGAPDFQVEGAGAAETGVAGAELEYPVVQAQGLEQGLGMAPQGQVVGLTALRRGQPHHFDLVELVDPGHAPGADAGGSGLAPEARGVGGVELGQVLGVEDLAAVEVGDRDLGRGDQAQAVFGAGVELVAELGQVAGPQQAGVIHQEGHRPLGVAVLQGVDVEEPADQGPHQSGTGTLEADEARAAELGPPVEIDDVEGRAEVPVGLGGEGVGRLLAPGGHHLVVAAVLAHRHGGQTGIGQGQELVGQLLFQGHPLGVDGGGLVAELAGGGLGGRHVAAVLGDLADVLGGRVLLALLGLSGELQGPDLLVLGQQGIDIDGGTPVTPGLAEQVRVGAEGGEVDHGEVSVRRGMLGNRSAREAHPPGPSPESGVHQTDPQISQITQIESPRVRLVRADLQSAKSAKSVEKTLAEVPRPRT